MKRIVIAILAAALAAGAQSKNDAERLLRNARNTELVDGDLKGAIKQYTAIVSKYAKSDRASTALALVHMAECYQKMGDAESHKIYEQVVKEYADQKEAAAEARAHLGEPSRQTNAMVWSGSKVNDDGTVTLDGRYLSSTDWDTGDLVIHEIATGVDRNLTHTGQGKDKVVDFAEGSAISRDGQMAAYSWYDGKSRHYDLHLANAAGDPNPRRLYDSADIKWLAPLDWAPDGKSVLVQIERSDLRTELGLVSLPGGSFRVLTSTNWRGADKAFFSPDGKWVGFDKVERAASPDHDVFVVAVDGGQEIHAVEHSGMDKMAGWSPDGKWLLFTSNRTGSMDLWAVAFEGGKVQGEPRLLKPGFGDRSFPLGITRNGTLYYGVDKGGTAPSTLQVASFDLSTGKMTGPVEITHGSSDGSPSWSPDGKELAYVSQRGQLNSPTVFARVSVLAIRSMETNASRELVPEMASFNTPSWSPDKRTFLVSGRDLPGRNGIFQIDAQSGAVSMAVLNPDKEWLTSPVWAPDGKRFYSVKQPSRGEPSYVAFVERDLATGAEREIVRRPQLGGLRLSPDGQYIATPSTDPAANTRVLLLIPVAGGEPRVLMSVPSGVKPEDLTNVFGKGELIGINMWDADSRSVIVATGSQISPNAKVTWRQGWRVPINGDEPRKLDIGIVGAMSPDGKRVAIVNTDPPAPHSTEIWALENFLPNRVAGK